MARKLVFVCDNEHYETSIAKLDRARVYGQVVKKAVDQEGHTCYFGSLSPDGAHLFGPGAFEMGHVDETGCWVERDELNAIDTRGNPLEKRESSFKGAIQLSETVSMDTYLDHAARLVYQLDAPDALLAKVHGADGLFCFPYNYNAGFMPDPAFLVANEDSLFLVVGEPCGLAYVGPDEIWHDAGEDEDNEDAALDFGMF